MTRPSYLAHRLVCWFIATHEIDWLMVHAGGIRQCKHCLAPMPEPRATVGKTHPDSGD